MQGQKPPSREEGERLRLLKELWCLPHAMDGWDDVLTTVQHVVEAQERLGHAFTYPACGWHHLGRPPEGLNIHEATARFGPSRQHDKCAFEQYFCRELIMVEIADVVLEHAKEAQRSGNMFRPEDFGMIVRNEAMIRVKRSPIWF